MSEREVRPCVVCSGDGGEAGDGATFERSCPKCSRMVVSDKSITFDGRGQPKGDNATCSRCGRVQMPFIGYP